MIEALNKLDLERSILIILSFDEIDVIKIDSPILKSYDLLQALKDSELFEIKEFQPLIKLLLRKIRIMLSQTQYNSEKNELKFL